MVFPGSRPAVAEDRDPRAVQIAGSMMEAMGGKAAFDAQRFLSFRFVVERGDEELANWLHFWDRYDGRYRLEGKTREGLDLRVIMNVNDRKGRVWLGGELQTEEQAAPRLEQAYGRFINDTYWLLMPWKWLDPGVHLAYEGEQTLDGTVYDVVQLSFEDEVGLTSSDHYWAYVSRESGLMERWAYVLQDEEGNPGTGEPRMFRWGDWNTIEGTGVRLSEVKTAIPEGDAPLRIKCPIEKLATGTEDGVFDPPPAADPKE
jgi:hypothetical protein